jgi:DNA polymerase III alpha subunit
MVANVIRYRSRSALRDVGKALVFSEITGTLQVEDNVVHLVAEKFWEPTIGVKPTGAPSRDFH